MTAACRFCLFKKCQRQNSRTFSLSCLEGAYFGHSSKEVQRLAKRIGRHIGIAFQVYDDILDYTADTETLKKPALEDLSQGVYTLPLLFAYQAHLTYSALIWIKDVPLP